MENDVTQKPRRMAPKLGLAARVEIAPAAGQEDHARDAALNLAQTGPAAGDEHIASTSPLAAPPTSDASTPVVSGAVQPADVAGASADAVAGAGSAALAVWPGYAAGLGLQRMESMLGEVNAHAELMVEKSTRFMTEVTEFSRGNVEALAQSNRAVVDGLKAIADNFFDYGRQNVEQASQGMRQAGSVKTPLDMLQVQNAYARGASARAAAEVSKMSARYMKLVNDVVSPLSGRLQLTASKLKPDGR